MHGRMHGHKGDFILAVQCYALHWTDKNGQLSNKTRAQYTISS